jgi:hypothetical protein
LAEQHKGQHRGIRENNKRRKTMSDLLLQELLKQEDYTHPMVTAGQKMGQTQVPVSRGGFWSNFATAAAPGVAGAATSYLGNQLQEQQQEKKWQGIIDALSQDPSYAETLSNLPPDLREMPAESRNLLLTTELQRRQEEKKREEQERMFNLQQQGRLDLVRERERLRSQRPTGGVGGARTSPLDAQVSPERLGVVQAIANGIRENKPLQQIVEESPVPITQRDIQNAIALNSQGRMQGSADLARQKYGDEQNRREQDTVLAGATPIFEGFRLTESEVKEIQKKELNTNRIIDLVEDRIRVGGARAFFGDKAAFDRTLGAFLEPDIWTLNAQDGKMTDTVRERLSAALPPTVTVDGIGSTIKEFILARNPEEQLEFLRQMVIRRHARDLMLGQRVPVFLPPSRYIPNAKDRADLRARGFTDEDIVDALRRAATKGAQLREQFGGGGGFDGG